MFGESYIFVFFSLPHINIETIISIRNYVPSILSISALLFFIVVMVGCSKQVSPRFSATDTSVSFSNCIPHLLSETKIIRRQTDGANAHERKMKYMHINWKQMWLIESIVHIAAFIQDICLFVSQLGRDDSGTPIIDKASKKGELHVLHKIGRADFNWYKHWEYICVRLH